MRRTSGITPPPDAAGAAIPVMPEVILTPPVPRLPYTIEYIVGDKDPKPLTVSVSVSSCR